MAITTFPLCGMTSITAFSRYGATPRGGIGALPLHKYAKSNTQPGEELTTRAPSCFALPQTWTGSLHERIADLIAGNHQMVRTKPATLRRVMHMVGRFVNGYCGIQVQAFVDLPDRIAQDGRTHAFRRLHRPDSWYRRRSIVAAA